MMAPLDVLHDYSATCKALTTTLSDNFLSSSPAHFDTKFLMPGGTVLKLCNFLYMHVQPEKAQKYGNGGGGIMPPPPIFWAFSGRLSSLQNRPVFLGLNISYKRSERKRKRNKQTNFTYSSRIVDVPVVQKVQEQQPDLLQTGAGKDSRLVGLMWGQLGEGNNTRECWVQDQSWSQLFSCLGFDLGREVGTQATGLSFLCLVLISAPPVLNSILIQDNVQR